MRVGIVGDSIAGLAAARAFAQLRADVSVFERSHANLADRGAGVALDPAVIDHIGPVEGEPVQGRVIIGEFGRELWRRDVAKVMTSWSKVYNVLRSGVSDDVIHTGSKVVECVAEDRIAHLRFEDGTQSSFDLVVGADGLGSVVREVVAPAFEPEYCRYVAIRGLTPAAELPAACEPLRRLADEPGLVNCYRRHTHLVAYWVPHVSGRALN